MKNKLWIFNWAVFFQTQMFMLPVLLLFYQHCGLSVGDFFLFQGIFSLSALLFEIPMGYLADVFPKRNILILSYSFFCMRLVLWLFWAPYGYWVLLAGEILYAAQKASFAGVGDSYIYEYCQHQNSVGKMNKRYGRMNFFMSVGTAFSSLIGAWLYHQVSEWTLSKYNYDYGFIVLIILELILNMTAICLLFRLPKIPRTTTRAASERPSYKKLFRNVIWGIANKDIRWHILYSGLLAAITVVFVWSFQPIMKLLLLPVSLYGLVYFINHFFRALGSLYADKIGRIVSLANISIGVFVLFVIGFLLTFIILNMSAVPTWMSLCYFVFVSMSIGMQLVFYLLAVGRLHTLVHPDKRATVSSVNTAVGRLYAGFFFILMKILLDGVSIQISLGICFVIFIVAAFPLKKVYTISMREEARGL